MESAPVISNNHDATQKIIIDTDPGIGMNNKTTSEQQGIGIAGGRPRVADFVHGSDGMGNINCPSPKSNKIEMSASEFLVEKVSEYPGDVCILALGPLTNLALAVKSDSSFASKVKRIVILGGAFFALGNVNPAAEANIYGDPEAADIVFTCGANIVVVGINITTQVQLTDHDIDELRKSGGKHAQFLSDMIKFYRDWHVKSDGVYGEFAVSASFKGPKKACDEIYVVREGETLQTISEKCGDPYIVEENPHIHDPDDVFPGLVNKVDNLMPAIGLFACVRSFACVRGLLPFLEQLCIPVLDPEMDEFEKGLN
ncbi:hypothetical protein LguiA_032380 [Lonicera macranthoides]